MRKGSIFEPLLLLALLISLTYAFYIFQNTAPQNPLKIGEVQGELIKSYGEGEKVLFFIEQAVLLAREQAIIELGENAGLIEYKCKEEVNGKLLWVWSKECNVDEIEKNYLVYFNKNLNFYFDKYEDFKIEKNNYEFEIENKKLTGKSKKALEFWIYNGNLKIGNYYTKPDFNIDFDYDLSIYNKLYEKALEVIDNCKEDLDCAKDKFKDFNADILKSGNFFDVTIKDKANIKFLIKIEKASLFSNY